MKNRFTGLWSEKKWFPTLSPVSCPGQVSLREFLIQSAIIWAKCIFLVLLMCLLFWPVGLMLFLRYHLEWPWISSILTSLLSGFVLVRWHNPLVERYCDWVEGRYRKWPYQ